MRFVVSSELRSFSESVRGGIEGWEPPLEPGFGGSWDDRDDMLAERLVALGWTELWHDSELLGATVAGSIELGRAAAPLCLVDEATLGGPLCIEGRVRHPAGASSVAVPLAAGVLVLAPWAGGQQEATLDGTGTLRDVVTGTPSPVGDAAERWRAWVAATLGYLAGLGGAALDAAVLHARRREQFGAPLGSLPAVQARLADALVACEGVSLCAWGSASADAQGPAAWDELSWAAGTVREVTAAVLQVHGAIGFALEGGVHRYFRRAKVVQVWGDACRRMLET